MGWPLECPPPKATEIGNNRNRMIVSFLMMNLHGRSNWHYCLIDPQIYLFYQRYILVDLYNYQGKIGSWFRCPPYPPKPVPDPAEEGLTTTTDPAQLQIHSRIQMHLKTQATKRNSLPRIPSVAAGSFICPPKLCKYLHSWMLRIVITPFF